METILKTFVCICFTLSLAIVSHAMDWRGIKPLHSTREDVERMLGKPPSPPKDGIRIYTLNKGRSIYFLEEGEIYIVYAEKEIPAAVDCLGKIPAGAVLMIQVTPKREMALSDLQIDEKGFRKFDPSEPPNIGYEGYIDEEDGMTIRTLNGKVEEIGWV